MIKIFENFKTDTILQKEIIQDKTLTAFIGVSFFMIFTACTAYVYIPLPFTPVPITLQTFSVLLCGAVLGKNLGSIAQFGYLVLGMMGVPVFSQGLGGWARIFGPTGGYLIGFILGAYFAGKMLSSEKKLKTIRPMAESENIQDLIPIILVFAGSMMIIYLLGTVHLSLLMKYPLKEALVKGVIPFIPGDILKLILAAKIYHLYQSRFRQIW